MCCLHHQYSETGIRLLKRLETLDPSLRHDHEKAPHSTQVILMSEQGCHGIGYALNVILIFSRHGTDRLYCCNAGHFRDTSISDCLKIKKDASVMLNSYGILPNCKEYR